jgi:uncharacterized protein
MGTGQEIDLLVHRLHLKPHPEGGYYREVYRSDGQIPQTALGPGFNGPRNYSTSIYFLLTSDNFSSFHRIRQDEVWHFYLGSALHVHVIEPAGNLTTHIVGNNIALGELPQVVVPAGCWFASGVSRNDSFSLVGCTVSPGFDFDDFELANRQELIDTFPRHSSIITAFTRK